MHRVAGCTDVEEDDDESIHKAMMSWSLMEVNPPPMASWGSEESLFGEEDDDEFLSLFFMVEFQKFFISLSVRPGNRAAI